MFQDLGGDVDRSVILADDFQARLHHVETHVVVGRFHLDGTDYQAIRIRQSDDYRELAESLLVQ